MTQRIDASEKIAPVQYVTTDDGYRIAYTVTGEGEPFVFMPCLLQNDIAQYDAGKADFLDAVARRFRLVQYDGRGTGNSTRGLHPDVKIEDTAQDLVAVVRELHLDRFVLYGDVFDTYTAFTVAIELQNTVRAIVLVNPQPFDGAPLMAEWEDMYTHSWELFTNTFASTFAAPETSGRQMREVVEQDDFARLALSAHGRFLADLLPKVKVPVLVLSLSNPNAPYTIPTARKIAAAIPGAELVLIDGRRISDILRNRDGFPPALRVIEDFLARIEDCDGTGQSAGTAEPEVPLSPRELEVLRLLTAGRSNPQIADELVISSNTVAKHVTSIFTKTGTANRVEATAYAHRNRLV